MTDIMAKARTQLLLKHPFFGSICLGLKLVEATDIPTMATNGKTLMFNREFAESIGLDNVIGVLCHEVMHVVNKHHLRLGSRDPDKWNVATDYAINETLKEAGIKIPQQGLFDDKYKNWAAERIYDDLPDEEPTQQGWNIGGVVQLTGENGKQLSQADIQIECDKQDAKTFAAADLAKSVGRLPANIAAMISEMRTATIEWRDLLRRAIGGEIPDDYTWSKLNRKWLSGYGVYMPGTQKFGIGELVAINDTSGSVHDNELEQFLGELSSIASDLGASGITVIGCDADVQSVEHYNPGEKIQTLNCSGRGGTCAAPAFNYLRDYGYTPDTVIYFTDGGIFDLADCENPGCDVIWAVTCDPEQFNPPFGDVVGVKISEQQEAA